MVEIEKESIALLKILELCSQSCANSMDKFKDLGVSKYESNPIVFIIDKFDSIVVDFIGNEHIYNIDLMVKNIKKYIRFNIK